MENLIRSQPKSAEPVQERLAQPHVDLAKVWWIITEVLPNHPSLQGYGNASPDAQVELARKAGDAVNAEVFDIQNAISHYLKLLVGSMKKHQSMPPTQALIQDKTRRYGKNTPHSLEMRRVCCPPDFPHPTATNRSLAYPSTYLFLTPRPTFATSACLLKPRCRPIVLRRTVFPWMLSSP